MRFQTPKNVMGSDLLQNSKIRPEFSMFGSVKPSELKMVYPCTPTKSGICWRKKQELYYKRGTEYCNVEFKRS